MGFLRRYGNHEKVINRPDTSSIIEVSEYSIWQLVNELRNLATSINYLYAEYDVMAEDTIIGAALQLYADNAVQPDPHTERILEITSDDKNLAKDLDSVVKRLNVEKRLWNTSYNTAKYGNKYWKILLTPNRKDIDSIEEIDDPSCVMDLYIKGNPSIFAYNDYDLELQKDDNYDLFDRNSFVHFMIQSGKINDRIELQDMTEIDERTGEPVKIKYNIVRGESMIEGVRLCYRVLKALEDNLLASQIARGELYRIFNIETGESNSTDAKKIVNKVKSLFDSKFAFNTRPGEQNAKSYNQPRPYLDPIFNSVTNGKGAISIETIGGDVSIKDIADIDYWNKIKFSGLHITPSMLAFEENIPGGLGSSANSMVQQDIRFAMYERKLITALLDGVTQLLNIWLTIKGRESEIGKFKVRMTNPSTAEDLARMNELIGRVEAIDRLAETIAKNAPGINSSELMLSLIDEYVPSTSLNKRIRDLIKETTSIADKELKIANAEADSTLRQLNRDEVPASDLLDDKYYDRDIDYTDINLSSSNTNEDIEEGRSIND